jgi:hypothetical protein
MQNNRRITDVSGGLVFPQKGEENFYSEIK